MKAQDAAISEMVGNMSVFDPNYTAKLAADVARRQVAAADAAVRKEEAEREAGRQFSRQIVGGFQARRQATNQRWGQAFGLGGSGKGKIDFRSDEQIAQDRLAQATGKAVAAALGTQPVTPAPVVHKDEDDGLDDEDRAIVAAAKAAYRASLREGSR